MAQVSSLKFVSPFSLGVFLSKTKSGEWTNSFVSRFLIGFDRDPSLSGTGDDVVGFFESSIFWSKTSSLQRKESLQHLSHLDMFLTFGSEIRSELIWIRLKTFLCLHFPNFQLPVFSSCHFPFDVGFYSSFSSFVHRLLFLVYQTC